jgi:hypothetical protein
LVLEGQPAGQVDLRIITELKKALGHSDPSYSSAANTSEPSARTTNSLYFQSSGVDFSIFPVSTVVTVDVTTIVQELTASGQWDSSILGFVISTVVPGPPNNYATVLLNKSKIRVTYYPSYKVGPSWTAAGILTSNSTHAVSARKSAGFVYDFDEDRVVMFGGMDGNVVLGDTHVGVISFNGSFDPTRVNWSQQITETTPEPRWGHSMVYDSKNKRVVMFGGFDSNHRPLNDLWFYSVASNSWSELSVLRDDQVPQPRAGASMVYYGDYDYNRAIDDYCIGGNKQKVVLFGGTDGNTYFNDTWVLDDDQGRWILASPVGEQSVSPPPRAFAPIVFAQNGRQVPDLQGDSTYQVNSKPPCATPVAFLFGGRNGTLPTGRDTDFDMVEDGTEHELGGQPAGRDPRVNALVVTNTIETIPYAMKRIGSVRPTYALTLLPTDRGAIANFESLRHDKPDVEHGALYNIPS